MVGKLRKFQTLEDEDVKALIEMSDTIIKEYPHCDTHYKTLNQILKHELGVRG